jgi:hypothetical protein
LHSAPSGMSALVGLTGVSGSQLLACWSAAGGEWTVSSPLPLTTSEQLESFGPASPNGMFVLLREASGTQRAFVLGTPGGSWQGLPTPPPGTATLSFGGSASPQALSVNDTVLTVWTLDSSSGHWAQGQVIKVPIQFGSSG